MSPRLSGVKMNGYNPSLAAACNDTGMPPPGGWAERLPQSRILLLPLLAGVISVAVTELGAALINDRPGPGSIRNPATAWIVQSFITGQILIFILAACGHALGRFRWPDDRQIGLNLGLTTAWACIGWTLWMALRLFAVETDELIAPLFVISLPILAITVPLLWHTTLKLGSLHRSFWVPAGFLAFSLLLQCWGTPRIAEDPVNLFILNSVLIVAAVVLWLIVYSLPPAAAPSQATQ